MYRNELLDDLSIKSILIMSVFLKEPDSLYRASDFSNKLKVSLSAIRKTLKSLTVKNILGYRAGKNCGYYLNCDLCQITVDQILDIKAYCDRPMQRSISHRSNNYTPSKNLIFIEKIITDVLCQLKFSDLVS